MQVYTGDGKGKTTAALGLALRAIGNDLNVIMVQFMKTARDRGEYKISRRLPNFKLIALGRDTMVEPGRPSASDIEAGSAALATARDAIMSGDYDLVILDEVNVAMSWGLVRKEEVISALKQRPERVEIVLTGRYAPAEIIELADLVTEMRCLKHPFQKGVPERAGIEY